MDELVTRKATFAAGCFWSIENAFRKIDGVIATKAGYSGGNWSEPTYKDVCSGKTGHAEVVQLEYDPQKIPYQKLLDEFWQMHDPTTLNRQGPDVGEQYRSEIFFHTPEQQVDARRSKESWQERSNREIVTEITPASTFYPAEEYHQCYLEKNANKHWWH